MPPVEGEVVRTRWYEEESNLRLRGSLSSRDCERLQRYLTYPEAELSFVDPSKLATKLRQSTQTICPTFLLNHSIDILAN